MEIKERFQERRTDLPDETEVRIRREGGWSVAAVVWERTTEETPSELRPVREVVPYGLRVADDCQHLEEDLKEKEIILLTLELIVQDFRLSQIAVELNHRNYRTREGASWNAASVFELLPRLIDVGPRIFSSREWAERRQRLFQVLQQ